jgi:hypothetical protein
MLKNKYRLLLSVVAFAAVLSSCAHTKFMNTWRDPEYQGHPGKVLVHAMTISPTVRIIFENQMVDRLEKRGVVALATHGLLPDDLVIDKEAMKKLVKEKGIDTIFVARPINRKDIQTLKPGQMTYATGSYASGSDDFEMAFAVYGYMPGTTAGEDVVMEIVLYDVSAKKRIRSAQAETFIWSTKVEEIKPAVDHLMKLLVADKVIP